jgi:hypothetical protein
MDKIHNSSYSEGHYMYFAITYSFKFYCDKNLQMTISVHLFRYIFELQLTIGNDIYDISVLWIFQSKLLINTFLFLELHKSLDLTII